MILYNHINGKSNNLNLEDKKIKDFITKYFNLHYKTINDLNDKLNINCFDLI